MCRPVRKSHKRIQRLSDAPCAGSHLYIKDRKMIFDTHTHYDDKAFQPDRAELMQKLRENGIGKAVNASSDWESLENTRILADQYDFIFAAYGLHPENLDSVPEGMTEAQALEAIRELLRTPKAVAVGEIGLDYYWEKDPEKQERQKHWFRLQLQLAREEKLPVIIHSRDAAGDTLRIAREEKLGEIGGVIHCFSYSREIAAEYLKMGMFLGIGGVVTYKNSRKLKETVEMAPLEQLVLETDCPYLTPVPNRGQRNSSLNLPYVIQAIAEIKGLPAEEVESATWKNAHRLYRMDEIGL